MLACAASVTSCTFFHELLRFAFFPTRTENASLSENVSCLSKCMPVPVPAHMLVSMCVCMCVSMCVCVGWRALSGNQHTCRWVFITAGLSDALACRRPLFIVISLYLISPHTQVSGAHWRPHCAFACAHTHKHKHTRTCTNACRDTHAEMRTHMLNWTLHLCQGSHIHTHTHRLAHTLTHIFQSASTEPPVHGLKRD